MPNPIHWHDGLFLQPHHLQAQQRAWLHQGRSVLRLLTPFPYGVVEASLSQDELSEGVLRFDALHVVLPGGTVFRFREEAELSSLDIRNAFRTRPDGFTVGLALPRWDAGRQNTVPYGAASQGADADLHYQVYEELLPDEHSGGNPLPIQLLRLNGRLIFAEDADGKLEFFPLLRVRPHAAEGGNVRSLDPQYVPATLILRGSPVLYRLVRDVAAAVAAVRNQLGEQLAASPLDLRALQGSQFEQINRLRALARGASQLGSMVDDAATRHACAGRVSPYDAYLALQDLLAELSSLYPAKRVFTWPPYDHEDPYPAFADLAGKIRAFLFPGGASFRKFDFALEHGHFFGHVPPGFFVGSTGCYLSIETDMAPTALARLVDNRDQFKLLPGSFVEVLAVRGLLLVEERNVPADLPLRAGQYYFRVDAAGSNAVLWERFQSEPRAAVHFQAPDLSRFRLALYVIAPPPPAQSP